MNKKILCFSAAGALLIIMITVSAILEEKEIFFPEMTALCIGFLIHEHPPWKVSKLGLVILMTISAFFGMFIASISVIPLIIKIFIAFIFIGSVIIISKSTLYPVISACILPVLMGTTNLIYPITVFILSVLVVFMRYIFEKTKIKDSEIELTDKNFNLRREFLKWAFMTVFFFMLSVTAVNTVGIFLIAPPLIVTFAEMSEYNSTARKNPFRIWLVISMCALIGYASKFIISEQLGASVILSAVIALTLMFIIMAFLKKIFPPAGAATLLAFLIDDGNSFRYPIFVSIGAIIFIAAAMLIGFVCERITSKAETNAVYETAREESREI